MGDDEAEYKAEYLDIPEDAEPEIANWLPRPGKARITYAGGSTFEGVFNGERIKEGLGKYTWMKAAEDEGEEPQVWATYEGEYRDGKRSGVGKMTYPNGDEYTGEWVNNAMEGEGTYVYKTSGDAYSGTWVASKKVGQGTYQFGADDSVMQGTWVDGSITEGKWIFKDGTVYTGHFKKGRPIGEGVYSFASGIVQKGQYVVVGDEEADEEEQPPTLLWRGESVVAC
ncbi:unnamed protein product [Discosporangium mesarthrocarpum]